MPRFFRKKVESLKRFQRRVVRQIEKSFRLVVRPFERAGRRASRVVVQGTDRIDRAGGLVAKSASLLLAPLRAVWNVITNVFSAVLPQSARKSLTKPFRRTARSVGKGLSKLAVALNLDRVFIPLAKLTRPIWKPIWLLLASASSFLAAWSTTRKYKRLVWALPAILLSLPLGVVGARGWVTGNARIAQTYELARRQANEAQELKLVHFYERKLAQLGVNNYRREYELALTFAEDGELDEAYSRMQRIAPLDQPGYLQARDWIIRHLLFDKIEMEEQQRLEAIGKHLDRLDELALQAQVLKYYRAVWLHRSDRTAEAIEVLAPIREVILEAASLSYRLNRSLAHDEAAREDALIIRREMELRRRQGDPITAQQYRTWHIVERFLGEPERAQTVLTFWFTSYPDDGEASNLISEIKRQQFERTLTRRATRPDRLVNLLTDAATSSTDPRKMLPHVALLFRQRNVNPLAASMIEQLLGSEQTPSSFLEAIGTIAAVDGDWELGRELLSRALEKDPQNAIAWNNWSWMLLNQPQPDIKGALDAVEKALALSPDDFYFRETRGQIYCQMNRWDEAIEDLEYASNGLPDLPEIHSALANAYEAIGETELAGLHRERSQ